VERYPHQIGVGGLVLTDCEKKLVNQVLDSGRLTYGPMTKAFEEGFARRHECKHALFVNSGTSALHLALQALKVRYGWSDGDEVIVPAVTFVATSNIVLHNNMVPVFVDVEAETYNIDPRTIEEKITKRTRAIIPVHLLGLPATMGPVLDIARKYGLKVIEDSCESMFAKYAGRFVGSMGDIGTFSTYVAHFLVTGVGGFCTTNSPELADDIRSLMNHGRDTIYTSCTDDHDVSEGQLEKIVARRFSFVQVGHSFRCTEMEAAIGIGQLERADAIIRRRKEIADRLTRGLSKFSDEIQLPVCPPDRTHSYMLYGITVKNDTKVKLVNHLESLNIETRDLLPLVNQPIYRRLYGDNLEDQFPVARRINHSAFYMGCHPYMSKEEVDFVIAAFENYFRYKR
jgi:dTDP-4-amino-4,6-dideoxygalactose transaminase